jgi:hypothetical protein
MRKSQGKYVYEVVRFEYRYIVSCANAHSVPCAKILSCRIVLRSFVIELLWYKEQQRKVQCRAQDACWDRSNAREKVRADEAPPDASETTAVKNRMVKTVIEFANSHTHALARIFVGIGYES